MKNSSGVVAETYRFSECNVVSYSTVFALWIKWDPSKSACFRRAEKSVYKRLYIKYLKIYYMLEENKL